MDDDRDGWERFFRQVVKEAGRAFDEMLDRFRVSLGDWLWAMLNWPTPDWREQLDLFVEHTRYYGLKIEPDSIQGIHDLVEARVNMTGPFAVLRGNSAGTPGSNVQIQLAVSADVGNTAHKAPEDSQSRAAFFNQKLAEAKGYLGKIEGILKGLAARLDAAKLREAVEIETGADAIHDRIWEYNDALHSARAAWLHGDLGGDAYERLAALDTPAALNLPLYTDFVQAQRAKEQEEQIGRRLGRSTAALERIILAIQVLEAAGPGVILPIGGGVVILGVQTTGPWCVVKYVPSEKGFPYAADVASGTAETLRGLPLASAVVTWWLLLRRPRPFAAKGVTGSGKQPSSLAASPKTVEPEKGEQQTNEKVKAHAAGYNRKQQQTSVRRAKSLGIQLRDLYFKRAAVGALIAPQLFTGLWEWLTNYHFSFQDDGSIENAANSEHARYAFMIEKAMLARVPTDGTWTIVNISNENIYQIISWKEYRMFIGEVRNTPFYDQASFWLGDTTEFRGHGSFEISLHRQGRMATAAFRNIQMVWAWVDEVDARAAIEYDWFDDNFWQGLLEVSLGDIVGDKIVNGNYWAVIGFTQTGRAGPFRFDLATERINKVLRQ